MAYRRTTWVESETALSAEHMNNIEDGVEEALAKAKGNEDMWHYMRNLIYPVGSIYMSVNSINPAALFGGTWVAWGTGRVPVGISTEAEFNAAEKTGGAKTVTLTAAQSGVPKHSHGFTQPTVPKHTHGFTQPTVPKHTHGFTQPTISTKSLTGSMSFRRGTTNGSNSFSNCWAGGSICSYKEKGDSNAWNNIRVTNGQDEKADKISLDASHNHTASGGAVGEKAAFATTGGAVGEKAAFATTGGAVSDNTAAAASAAHTNLQPYITCYMWKRTA